MNRRYYPFTENNPFAPWYSKWSIALFGESVSAKTARLRDLNIADSRHDIFKVASNPVTGLNTHYGFQGTTPNFTGAGIGINSTNPGTPGFKAAEMLSATVLHQKLDALGAFEVMQKLKNIQDVPLTAEITGGNWADHVVDKTHESYNMTQAQWRDHIEGWKKASGSNVKLEDLPKPKSLAVSNKFATLGVESSPSSPVSEPSAPPSYVQQLLKLQLLILNCIL